MEINQKCRKNIKNESLIRRAKQYFGSIVINIEKMNEGVKQQGPLANTHENTLI